MLMVAVSLTFLILSIVFLLQHFSCNVNLDCYRRRGHVEPYTLSMSVSEAKCVENMPTVVLNRWKNDWESFWSWVYPQVALTFNSQQTSFQPWIASNHPITALWDPPTTGRTLKKDDKGFRTKTYTTKQQILNPKQQANWEESVVLNCVGVLTLKQVHVVVYTSYATHYPT